VHIRVGVGIEGVRVCVGVKASCMHVQVDIKGAPLGPKGMHVGIEGARGVKRMCMSMNIAGKDMGESDMLTSKLRLKGVSKGKVAVDGNYLPNMVACLHSSALTVARSKRGHVEGTLRERAC
jgi:hypothetical protein